MSKTCLKCNLTTDGEPLACPGCGAVYAKLEQLANAGQIIRSVRPTPSQPLPSQQVVASVRTTDEALAYAWSTGDWSKVPPDLVRREAAAIVLSTTETAPGRQVSAIRGVVSADYAFAFGAIFEEFAGLARNLVGSGRSGMTTNFLAAGRAEALQSLRYSAMDHRANAVLGIRIDYEEFSGANSKGILVVTATGTAVWLDPPLD